jgi:hypothetical protein
MRLADWPRMPFLSDELHGWITEHLATLGVEEIAVYAVEEGSDDDARRVLVATEIGLIDYHYGPRASTARFAISGRIVPWQAVRGVDLRVETFRLWALEHRTRWSLAIARPRFAAGTEDPILGRALADFSKVAVIMAEPSGWSPPADVAAEEASVTELPARPMVDGERPLPSAPVASAVTRSASHPRS